MGTELQLCSGAPCPQERGCVLGRHGTLGTKPRGSGEACEQGMSWETLMNASPGRITQTLLPHTLTLRLGSPPERGTRLLRGVCVTRCCPHGRIGELEGPFQIQPSPALNFMGEETQVQGRSDLFQVGVERDLNLEPLVCTPGSGGLPAPHTVFPLRGVGLNALRGAGRSKASDTVDFIPRVWSPRPHPCHWPLLLHPRSPSKSNGFSWGRDRWSARLRCLGRTPRASPCLQLFFYCRAGSEGSQGGRAAQQQRLGVTAEAARPASPQFC